MKIGGINRLIISAVLFSSISCIEKPYNVMTSNPFSKSETCKPKELEIKVNDGIDKMVKADMDCDGKIDYAAYYTSVAKTKEHLDTGVEHYFYPLYYWADKNSDGLASYSEIFYDAKQDGINGNEMPLISTDLSKESNEFLRYLTK